MATRVAINGFGRIGRLGLRAILERHKKDLSVVAVNDMADLQTNAHLFRYDSTYGIYPGKVETGSGMMKIDGRRIAVLTEKDPSRLPWKQLAVDIVINRRGKGNWPRFTGAEGQIAWHILEGADFDGFSGRSRRQL